MLKTPRKTTGLKIDIDYKNIQIGSDKEKYSRLERKIKNMFNKIFNPKKIMI